MFFEWTHTIDKSYVTHQKYFFRFLITSQVWVVKLIGNDIQIKMNMDMHYDKSYYYEK